MPGFLDRLPTGFGAKTNKKVQKLKRIFHISSWFVKRLDLQENPNNLTDFK